MLNDIEVLDKPDDNFWMAKAYLVPATSNASVKPGEKGLKMIPVNRMVPRSFFANVETGSHVPAVAPLRLRGIAFGGDTGVDRQRTSTRDDRVLGTMHEFGRRGAAGGGVLEPFWLHA